MLVLDTDVLIDVQRGHAAALAWFAGLDKRGIVRGGQPLAREGKVISKSNERTISDGPFAEAKEVVGGYLIVEVAHLNEAIAIARECPTLDFGIEVEVRPMLDDCPISARLRQNQSLAAA